MKLSSLISSHKVDSNIKTATIALSKEFCDEAIKLNTKNRPMSKAVSKLYGNEMYLGRWKANGENIIFGTTESGEEILLSGQHRIHGFLHALTLVQDPDGIVPYVEVTVATGVDSDAADTMDTGKLRSNSDVLFRDSWVDDHIGEDWGSTIAKRKTWTKTLANAIRFVWIRRGGGIVASAPKFISSEMLDFLKNDHADLCDFVTMVLDVNASDSDNGGLKMSLGYIAALSYIACLDANGKVSEDKADQIQDFLTLVASGTGYSTGSVAHALTGYWNKLVSSPGSKDRDREWTGPFVKALRALLNGDTAVKASSLALNKKEQDAYSAFPPLFDGWDTWCFEQAALARMKYEDELEEAKRLKEQAKAEVVQAEELDEEPVTPPAKPRKPRTPKPPKVTTTEVA